MLSLPERTKARRGKETREMYGTQDLQMVLRMQDEQRRAAANARLAARINKREHRTANARRVFGLRLSLA
jgi:hypothetical protein